MSATQGDLFDQEQEIKREIKEGKNSRDLGMARAALANLDQLAKAREIARECAQRSIDSVTDADEVQRICIERGIELGNAAGSLFRGKQWQWTGKFKSSNRASNHRRVVRIWKLVKL